ncbi:hypothetical protein C8J56DRAFT_904377 [Mycena floridula]|nr:hypothetical protein C8J56DRAFT_904377 [Mycena floridula]
MTDTTMTDTSANVPVDQSRLPAESLEVLQALHAAITALLVANNITIPAAVQAHDPAATTIEMNPVFNPPPHPDILDQHFVGAPDKDYSVVIKGHFCGHSRRWPSLSPNTALVGMLELSKRSGVKICPRILVRHSEARRAASLKYYHERRKYVLQERRNAERDQKLLARSGQDDERQRRSPPARSPMPPSTPPSINSSDEDDNNIDEADAKLIQPLLTLMEDIHRWYAFWGGASVWEIVVDKIHDTKSPLEPHRRSQLIKEIDLHISLGTGLDRRLREIGTGELPSSQENMRVFMNHWASAGKNISDGLSIIATLGDRQMCSGKFRKIDVYRLLSAHMNEYQKPVDCDKTCQVQKVLKNGTLHTWLKKPNRTQRDGHSFTIMSEAFKPTPKIMSDDFKPTPEIIGHLKDLSPQFDLCNSQNRLDIFRDFFTFQWDLIYPRDPKDRRTSKEIQRWNEDLWSLSLEFSSHCNPCPLPLGRFPTPITEQILKFPLEQISVLDFMKAEHELARQEAIQQLEKIPAVSLHMDFIAETTGIPRALVMPRGSSTPDWLLARRNDPDFPGGFVFADDI